MSFWTAILILLFSYLVVKWYRKTYDYWRKLQVPVLQPVLPLLGNFASVFLFRKTIFEFLRDCYEKSTGPYQGVYIFNTPYLILRNLDMIRQILITDFESFDNHTVQPPQDVPLESNMFFMSKNPDWRIFRSKLRPFFSGGKLRRMSAEMFAISQKLGNFLQSCGTIPSLDAREICAKYATDVIAKCAYSIDANSLQLEDSEFVYSYYGKIMFGFSYVTGIQQLSMFFLQKVARLVRMRFFPPEIDPFLRRVMWDAIRDREKSGVCNGTDAIAMTIQMQNDKEFCRKMNFFGDRAIAPAAQLFTFFDTTSIAMSFTLYELCLNHEIQTKLRSEIIENLDKFKASPFEAIETNLGYLHKCFCEALRKYSPVPFVDRHLNRQYQIPGTDLVLEKGARIFAPVSGLHYDPRYYPDPERYDPERFDESTGFHDSMAFLPFGQGPRSCLGERFAILAAKIGLVAVLANFVVEKVDSTPAKIRFETKSFTLASKDGLPMRFRPIN